MLGTRRALRTALALASLAGLVGGCSLEDLVTSAPVRGLSADPPALSDSVPSGSTQTRNRTVVVTGPPWRAALVRQSAWVALGSAGEGEPSRLTVALKPSGLAPARYADTVIITSESAGAVKVPVELVILASPDTAAPPPPPPPAATGLVFSVQPGAAVSGAAIAPPVRVSAVDAAGKTVTAFRGTITIGLAANPAGGALSGTTTAAATDGVAVFGNLVLDRAGSGYSLRASATGLVPATSAAFAVSAGPPSATRSTIAASPAELVASTGSSSSLVTITARDAAGNPVAGAPVSFSVSGEGNTLSATSANTDATGAATVRFSSTRSGSKTITASTGGISLTVTVLVRPAPASQLRFTVQPPATVEEDRYISPAPVVTALDPFGNVATDYRADVKVALEPNLRDAKLGGDTTERAFGGVVTFPSIRVDRWGGPFRIIATASGLASAVSDGFLVVP